jgi:hypothetical protein
MDETGPGTADAWGTSRRSRLFPGPFLVHADLHNHTQLSDGSGDPAKAFGSMRSAGLDVAALTDHARWASAFLSLRAAPGRFGIDGYAWKRMAELAEAHDDPGSFVAIRGFEWSHLLYGHMNVWGSERLTDPLRTSPTIRSFWRWLDTKGQDGLASFNHPGTGGPYRFARFRHHPAMDRRLVALELFNKTNEFLFNRVDRGEESPLNQCLNAGWRPGLIGVTDEHGTNWGEPEGKGRAGLYVTELTRSGVAEALLARRSFAARVKGLRLDVALTSEPTGVRARMGGSLRHPGGAVRLELDLDRAGWDGTSVNVQVLRPGTRVPSLAANLSVTVPPPDGEPVTFDLDLDPADGEWVVLRVSDPAGDPDPRATPEYAGLGRGIAYSSPVWLSPRA